MTEQFIQQQIAEFRRKYPSSAPKKEIAVEMPKVQTTQSVTSTPAPKKSNVFQLQCTNFPKKSSESSKSSEYTEDSEDSEYSDNIASDSSESCACDEEGPCDHHFLRQAIAKYWWQQHATALVSGKK
jgi:hypothetical protein